MENTENNKNPEIELNETKKEIEYKNLRYEHSFKFIWFFWMMLGAGVSLFVIFNINEYDKSLCTLGSFIMSVAITLLFITARYLICEKDTFILNKEIYKNCNEHIEEAENLYIISNILTHIFFHKIIPMYIVFMLWGSYAKFNIYNFIKEECALWIFGSLGIIHFLLWIVEKIESIKFKNSHKDFKNPLNNTYLTVANYILLFLGIFAFCIILQNRIFIPTTILA